MKLLLIIAGIFILILFFLYIWYHIEIMQDELLQIDKVQHKDDT